MNLISSSKTEEEIIMTNKKNSIYTEKKSKNNQLKELGHLKETAILKQLKTNGIIYLRIDHRPQVFLFYSYKVLE